MSNFLKKKLYILLFSEKYWDRLIDRVSTDSAGSHYLSSSFAVLKEKHQQRILWRKSVAKQRKRKKKLSHGHSIIHGMELANLGMMTHNNINWVGLFHTVTDYLWTMKYSYTTLRKILSAGKSVCNTAAWILWNVQRSRQNENMNSCTQWALYIKQKNDKYYEE